VKVWLFGRQIPTVLQTLIFPFAVKTLVVIFSGKLEPSQINSIPTAVTKSHEKELYNTS